MRLDLVCVFVEGEDQVSGVDVDDGNILDTVIPGFLNGRS